MVNFQEHVNAARTLPAVGTPIDQELANAILTKAWEIHAKNQALRALLHKIDVGHMASGCVGCEWYPGADVAIALESK